MKPRLVTTRLLTVSEAKRCIDFKTQKQPMCLSMCDKSNGHPYVAPTWCTTDSTHHQWQACHHLQQIHLSLMSPDLTGWYPDETQPWEIPRHSKAKAYHTYASPALKCEKQKSECEWVWVCVCVTISKYFTHGSSLFILSVCITHSLLLSCPGWKRSQNNLELISSDRVYITRIPTAENNHAWLIPL